MKDFIERMRYSHTAKLMAIPSWLEVPRPNSSMMICNEMNTVDYKTVVRCVLLVNTEVLAEYLDDIRHFNHFLHESAAVGFHRISRANSSTKQLLVLHTS